VSDKPSTDRPSRILLVDDQPAFREQASFLLEMEGYRVTTASDGADALRVLSELTPDLILADIMMPRMTGFQLREKILEDARLAAIPFIFVTARDRSANEDPDTTHADVQLLSKPFDPDELLAIIEENLGRRRGGGETTPI
jgi:CheY-like chemotaxis protein